jgi:aryl-alcohol dehydrogenase-like predicted oxidoreductase
MLGTRPLGSSGLDVSVMSLGSWRTFERLPAGTRVAIMRAARDEGINFFDDARYNDETGTAPIPTGYSELVFGELFRGAGVPRDEAVVTNKLWWEFWPEQSAAAELDASLQRMGFDYIDMIYANPPPEGMPVAELVAATVGLIGSGKARAWGLVNWHAQQAQRAVQAAADLGVAQPCAIQLPYSLVRRDWVEDPEMARVLDASGAGLIASFSLAADDPRVVPAAAAARDLASLAARLGTTPATLALAFPFTHPALASVLFGATSPEQVRADSAAAGLFARIGPADLAELRRIGARDETR